MADRDRVIRESLDAIVDPPDATVDIIAIPGLGANPPKSWMWDEKDPNSFNWLSSEDGLKKDFPKARVLLYHYASAYRGPFKIKQYMSNIVRTLLDALQLKREVNGVPIFRPTVLIGHSMGGLVAARALLLADQQRVTYPNIYESIVACVTFGTPFGGAPVADIAREWTKIHEQTRTAVSSKLLDLLTPGNENLRELREDFLYSAGKLAQKVEIHCFYEELPTHWGHIVSKLSCTDFPQETLAKLNLDEYRYFVSRESATLHGVPHIGLARTHRNLVRFENFKDYQYQLVRAPLKRIINSASLNAKNRFKATNVSAIDRQTLTSVLSALEGADVEKKFKHLSKRLAPQPWIVREPEYLSWRQNEGPDDGYLWIHGSEGKGKTLAVAAAIRDLKEVVEDDSRNTEKFPSLLAHIICDQTPEFCTAEDIVKSLLYQLCQQQEILATYAKQFMNNKSKATSKLSGTQDTQKGDESADSKDLEVSDSKAVTTKEGKPKSDSSALGIENLWQCLRDMLTEGSIGTIYFVIGNLHELPEEDPSTKKLVSFLAAAIQESTVGAGSRSTKRVRTKWLVASRDRRYIQEVLGATTNPQVRGINLEDPKYGDKVKSELQKHAWGKVEDLQKEKGYNKAMAYFAGSVIGNRATSAKWIDVAIVQLRALPAGSNDIKVRRMLERVPEDFTALLDHAWMSILKPADDDMDTIKELLRALVLTYEDPTESELLVLAGLPQDACAKESLHKMIEKCKPLVTHRKSGDEYEISFVSPEVKRHLYRSNPTLLDLEAEAAVKLQHGILALRCFSHVVDCLTAALQPPPEGEHPEVPDVADIQESATQGPRSQAGETVHNQDPDSDSEDDYGDYDTESEDDSEEYMAFTNANGLIAPAENAFVILRYATKYWLRHASEATPDIAERLSLEKPFWDPDSQIRRKWLEEYEELTSAFEGFVIESLKGLHVAAAVGFPNLVESLIKAGYGNEVAEYDDMENTPLHFAAWFGKTEIVEQLLLKGAEKDDAGESKVAATPLAMAAQNGNTSTMAKLMSWNADHDAIDEDMGPVINFAIQSGSTEAVKMLIAKGARLNYDVTDDLQWLPPLALAASSDLTMLNTIIEAGKDSLSQKEYNKALIYASESGRVEVVGRLLQFDIDEAVFQDALESARLESNWDVIKLLLQHSNGGLNCGDVFETAATSTEDLEDVLEAVWEYTRHGISQEVRDRCLYRATDMEKEETVKTLLKMGASPDALGDEYGNALTAASNDGTSSIIATLLAHGASINSPNGFALQAAASQGHYDVVVQLLDAGAHVNYRSPTHASGTALQAACDYGCSKLVALLISRGADPNLGSGVWDRPIISAVMDAEPAILQVLLEAPGIEVNVVGGPDQSSPLHCAVVALPATSVRLLLDAGADVDMLDKNGNTALILAAQNGDHECVQALLEHGADVMAASPEHGTALEVAVREDNEECVELLVARALVLLHEMKRAADAGDEGARRIIEAERMGRREAMAEEEKKRKERSREEEEEEANEAGSQAGTIDGDAHGEDDGSGTQKNAFVDVDAQAGLIPVTNADGNGGELVAAMESLRMDDRSRDAATQPREEAAGWGVTGVQTDPEEVDSLEAVYPLGLPPPGVSLGFGYPPQEDTHQAPPTQTSPPRSLSQGHSHQQEAPSQEPPRQLYAPHGAPLHQSPPQEYSHQGYLPQAAPPHQSPPPQQEYPAQMFSVPPQGYRGQESSQGYPPQTFSHQGFAPQGSPQAYPQRAFSPQTFSSQGTPSQAYPPQRSSQVYSPQRSSSQGFSPPVTSPSFPSSSATPAAPSPLGYDGSEYGGEGYGGEGYGGRGYGGQAQGGEQRDSEELHFSGGGGIARRNRAGQRPNFWS